jgi:5-methylcytosine-specific restriction endonuclease McrA
VEILRRDSFTCRYCGIRTVFLPVLHALSSKFPDSFPVDAGWTAQGTHPAYSLLSATYDHILSPTRGGESEPENVVTSCWPCNSGKSNYTVEEVGFELLPPGDSDWDGLTEVYPELCKSLSVQDLDYHRRWLGAISSAGTARTSTSSRSAPRRELPLSMQSETFVDHPYSLVNRRFGRETPVPQPADDRWLPPLVVARVDAP